MSLKVFFPKFPIWSPVQLDPKEYDQLSLPVHLLYLIKFENRQKELNCKGITHERKVDINGEEGTPIYLATKRNFNTRMTWVKLWLWSPKKLCIKFVFYCLVIFIVCHWNDIKTGILFNLFTAGGFGNRMFYVFK